MDQPSFEGRPLPRPEEEVFDQGLAFDLETMNRRRALRYLGIGASAAALAACGGTTDSASTSSTSAVGASSSSSTSTTTSTTASGDLTEIPDETAGPYPGDGSNGPNVLTEDGVVRQDITTSFGDYSGTAEGIPATIELTILDMANGNAVFAGVAVYVWHCNRDGNYSLYSDGSIEAQMPEGMVRFASIDELRAHLDQRN